MLLRRIITFNLHCVIQMDFSKPLIAMHYSLFEIHEFKCSVCLSPPLSQPHHPITHIYVCIQTLAFIMGHHVYIKIMANTGQKTYYFKRKVTSEKNNLSWGMFMHVLWGLLKRNACGGESCLPFFFSPFKKKNSTMV